MNEADFLGELLRTEPTSTRGGVVVGQLVGFKNNGATPLVSYPGQPGTAAIEARAILDLHGEHLGRNVVLVFENEDPVRPIVVGRLFGDPPGTLRDPNGRIDVEADGERLIVTAREQLILRCGKASITLTRQGKVLIRGEFVSSQAGGVNRLKGGCVQIN